MTALPTTTNKPSDLFILSALACKHYLQQTNINVSTTVPMVKADNDIVNHILVLSRIDTYLEDLYAVKYKNKKLKNVCEVNRTYELCIEAIKNSKDKCYNDDFKYVPEIHKTYYLCSLAITRTEKALHYLPIEYKNDNELRRSALKTFKYALRWIPFDERTYELCYFTVKVSAGDAIKHVPLEHKSDEMCLMAIESGLEFLMFIPPEKMTEEICLTMVTRNAYNYAYDTPFQFKKK
jgi:hypothetical protein